MTVTFYKLGDEGATYNEVATVEDGEIVAGEDELPPLVPEELEDEDRLVRQFDGPYLVASVDDEDMQKRYVITEPRRGIVGRYAPDGTFEYRGADSAVRKFLDMGDPSGLQTTRASLVALTPRETNLLKQGEDAWIPYQGPQGGEGWQQVGSGEVRYQQNPPGNVAEGYDENHWQQHWPELDGTEWNEDLPDVIDMNEGDSVLFVNRNGQSEVGEVVTGTFVRRDGWDSAKMGVRLRDGREVTVDELSAYAPTATRAEPPELAGDGEWDDAPGVWNEYAQGDLIQFTDDNDESRVGLVEGSVADRGAIKVQTTDQFHVVGTDSVLRRADVSDDYNKGYELLDSPFENTPDVPFSLDAPAPEFVSEHGATVDDVRNAFARVFGADRLESLEAEINQTRPNPTHTYEEPPDYDTDDPEDWIRAARAYRGAQEANVWPEFKWELRGRANGMGTDRTKRVINEAFALDIADPLYDIRDRLDGEEENQPEEWLKAAAEFAIENDKWVSIAKLQDAVDDWSGTAPFTLRNVHDHDGQPDEIVPLSETGENAGISAGAMFIAEWDDGKQSYVTRIRDEQTHGAFHSEHMESSIDAERAMTAFHVQSALNEANETVHYPDHEYRMDDYLSVDGAPEEAVLADHYLDEKPTEHIELPDGKPDNDVVNTLGADVGDVQAAISETLQPGWVDDAEEIIDNDPNLDVENAADWVAAAKQVYDPNKARVWNKFTEELASEAYESPVARDDFMDMAAAGIIAGNRDLHSKNVMADDDGHIYPIDLDFGGHDMGNERHLSEAVGKLVMSADALGIEVSDEFADEGDPNAFDKAKRPLGQEILAHIEGFAQRNDSDTVLSANPMYGARGMGDNVQDNFERAKRGELSL